MRSLDQSRWSSRDLFFEASPLQIQVSAMFPRKLESLKQLKHCWGTARFRKTRIVEKQQHSSVCRVDKCGGPVLEECQGEAGGDGQREAALIVSRRNSAPIALLLCRVTKSCKQITIITYQVRRGLLRELIDC